MEELVLWDMDGDVCTVEDLGDFHGEGEILVRSCHGVILRVKDGAVLRDWLTQWIEEQERERRRDQASQG